MARAGETGHARFHSLILDTLEPPVSHVLAVFDVEQGDWGPTYQPTLMPISADMYTRDFRTNIIPQSPPGTPYPVPYWDQQLSPSTSIYACLRLGASFIEGLLTAVTSQKRKQR